MERRTFLSLCSATVALGTASRLGLHQDSGPFCHVAGELVFPGAPLSVDLDLHVPRDATLHLRVVHGAGEHRSVATTVTPGQRVTLETPYPHADLVPGDYVVHLDLLARGGRLLQTLQVGTYRVVPFRFSV